MIQFLNFTFQGFWTFVGMVILIGMPLNFLNAIITLLIRHRTIRKHGYPPAHCDTDGDFKKEKHDN